MFVGELPNMSTVDMRPPTQLEGSVSHSTINPNLVRNELNLARKQVQDMRATNLFLKKEKLKAEHERNIAEIRTRQLEDLCNRLA